MDGQRPTERPIGPHLALGAGLLKAAARAGEIGATAVQLFTDNPTAWRRRPESPRDLEQFRADLAAAGIGPIAVHAPYLVNLCGANEDFWHKSVSTMANELRVGATYGASFVVMHVGSHRGLDRAEGISRLARGIRRVLRGASKAPVGGTGRLPMLVLENAAGTGDGIGSTIEDLADMLEAASRSGVAADQLGICLDTAHLWGAGYDISRQQGIETLFTRFDELIGRERLVMLHLNDSRTTLDSHLDRHEHIGGGHVGADGLREFLAHPWLAAMPTYLETPGMDSGYDQTNLERVRMLLSGETLPPLPPEAFEVRGSRARTAPPGA